MGRVEEMGQVKKRESPLAYFFSFFWKLDREADREVTKEWICGSTYDSQVNSGGKQSCTSNLYKNNLSFVCIRSVVCLIRRAGHHISKILEYNFLRARYDFISLFKRRDV